VCCLLRQMFRDLPQCSHKHTAKSYALIDFSRYTLSVRRVKMENEEVICHRHTTTIASALSCAQQQMDPISRPTNKDSDSVWVVKRRLCVWFFITNVSAPSHQGDFRLVAVAFVGCREKLNIWICRRQLGELPSGSEWLWATKLFLVVLVLERPHRHNCEFHFGRIKTFTWGSELRKFHSVASVLGWHFGQFINNVFLVFLIQYLRT
jgi:hypothetical protein